MSVYLLLSDQARHQKLAIGPFESILAGPGWEPASLYGRRAGRETTQRLIVHIPQFMAWCRGSNPDGSPQEWGEVSIAEALPAGYALISGDGPGQARPATR